MILSRILEHKKAELRHKQSRGYLSELKAKIRDDSRPTRLRRRPRSDQKRHSPALIAEVKKASPSLGLLRPEFSERFDAVGMARAYQEAGASAVFRLDRQGFFPGKSRLSARHQTIGFPAGPQQRIHGR